MTLILESLSFHNDIAYSDKSLPFKTKYLSAIMQHYCYNRWLDTKFSQNTEFNYVLKAKVNSAFVIRAYPLYTGTNTIPIITPNKLSKVETIKVSNDNMIEYITCLSGKRLYGKVNEIDRNLIEQCILLVDGNWYVVINGMGGATMDFLNNLTFKGLEYGNITDGSYKLPSTKLPKLNKELSITQSLKLLKKLTILDNNKNTMASIMTVNQTVYVEAIPSITTIAKFVPDYREFSKNIINVREGIRIYHGSFLPYYYTGFESNDEHMIVYINGKWYMLDQENSRLLLRYSSDENRVSKKEFKKVDIKKFIEKFEDFNVNYTIDTNQSLESSLYTTNIPWMISGLLKTDKKLNRLSNQIEFIELPSMEIVHFKIRQENEDSIHYVILNDDYYELSDDTSRQIDNLESIQIWSNT